ncbi:MAG: glycosyltransferase family 4 protein [Oscillatoriales cyanobacterium C42_A2020_001]|nr:glycosyltransferase family 4 protein [Leptolyngbyaceae cyanobacterium C42_A2020_001]
MRLLLLQYAGDYREAVQRFAAGGNENYYAQKYTVNGIAELTPHFEEVSVLCCQTDEFYNEVLDNGVRAIGAGFCGWVDEEKVVQLIEQQRPTHLVLHTPLRKVLRWAIKNQVKVLTLIAESIVVQNWRDRLRGFRLARLLNHPQISWVGSYGLASSKRMKAIGVKADKIIPWDLLIEPTPGSYEPKTLTQASEPWKLLYVGAISELKGVGDILRAVKILRDRQFPVRLSIVGKDSEGAFARLAETLNVADVVEFLGMIPTSEVVPQMRNADAVLVPSRHEYTEGFPLTIHHALCSRTPIIASDHPMFQEHLKHEVNALIFPAQNPVALAASIDSLFKNPSLYAALSQASYDTWYHLRLPVKWGDLLNRWVFPSSANDQWLYEHRLSAVSPQQKPIAIASSVKTPLSTR